MSFYFCLFGESAEIFERKVWRVQVTHSHRAAPLHSPGRCFKIRNCLTQSLKFEQLQTTKVPSQGNSNRHKRIELWAKSIKDFVNLGRHFPLRHLQKFSQHEHACSARDSVICSKNRKIDPYHKDSPNTRNGSPLRSPTLIMAAVFI